MFKLKFPFVLLLLTLGFLACESDVDPESDPENSCEHSGLRIESIFREGSTLTASATGGTPPYEYMWDDGTEGNVLVGWPGTYRVTVTDSKGCTAIREQFLEGIDNILGVWEMDIFNNDVPVGQYINEYSTQCPDIVVGKTSMSGSFEFPEGVYEGPFNFTITDYYIDTQVTFNADCEITEDLPDTETETTETGNGSISYDGENFILYYYDTGNTETITLLGQDRIKIAQEEYVRQ